MNEILRLFNGDVHTKEALKAYITTVIAEEGVRKMFAREDVSGVAEAKELIDKAFMQLELDYGIPNQSREQTNQAK